MNTLFILPKFPEYTVATYNRVMQWAGKKASEPNLGIITVAGLLPQHWGMRHKDLSFQEVTEDDWRWAETVFLTGMTIQQREVTAVIHEAKRRNKPVVVGGPWVFHGHDDAIKEGADIVVVGEAEGSIQRVIEHLERGRSGQILKAPDWADMTQCPPPRWDLLDMFAYNTLPIQFCRGCPFHCEFCDATLLMGKAARAKTPQQVIDELQILYNLKWRGEVAFVDDNVIGNVVLSKKMCREVIPWMEKHNYPFEFVTQTSVNLAKARELLELMVKAGFTKTCVGIETLEKQSLLETKKFQNVKPDMEKALLDITAAGIRVKATYIIGFDTETPGVDERLIEFTQRSKVTDVLLNPMVAYQGTDLWKRMKREGRLIEWGDEGNLGSVARLPNFLPTRPVEDIGRELIRFYEAVYEPTICLDRAYNQTKLLGRSPRRTRWRWPVKQEMRLMAAVIYTHGIARPTRWHFWKRFFDVAYNTPWKIYYFLNFLAFADHYFGYRKNVRAQVGEALKAWENCRVQTFETAPDQNPDPAPRGA